MIKIKLLREPFLKALQMIIGVVERRPTIPILSYALMVVEDNCLTLTATDLEVQISASVPIDGHCLTGRVAVSARKLVDICRVLNQEFIELIEEEQRIILKAGRGKYVLATLPADNFPSIEEGAALVEGTLAGNNLLNLLEKNYFAVASQDVRTYLNGMLWQIEGEQWVTVSSNGHRIMVAKTIFNGNEMPPARVIVPRKSINEIIRLLSVERDQDLSLTISANHIRISGRSFVFVSKLIDAQFPDFRRLVPRNADKFFLANKEELKQLLTRAIAFSNQELPIISLELSDNLLKTKVFNEQQENAEDEIEIEYTGPEIVFCFNASYLIDGANIIKDEQVKFAFYDEQTPILMEALTETDTTYVVMPMLL